MQTFESLIDARNAIMDFRAAHGSDLPEHLSGRFRDLSASPSPVDQIVGLAEFIYANRDQVTQPTLLLGAGLAAFATVNAWHGLVEDNRGDSILSNLRKDAGEIQRAVSAPEARPGYRIEPSGAEGEEGA